MNGEGRNEEGVESLVKGGRWGRKGGEVSVCNKG